MNNEKRFRIAAPEVIHQEIDGEVVLIHLGRGTYHSLRGSGAWLFSLIAQGASQRDLAVALAARYDGDGPAFEREVARFLSDLCKDELVLEATPTAGAAGPSIALPSNGEARRPFEAPRVETFTDLQELILSDPIHDVDAAGWPHMPPGGAA